MGIYFDNSATTRIDPIVMESIYKYNNDLYANPSAMHRFGFLVENDIKKANETLSDVLGCEPNEVIWTSGGTESNNMAIFGYINAHKKEGNHIITTKIEHASVLNIFKSLEKDGYDVTYLNVDENGRIRLDELQNAIKSNTLLVSIMFINNVIGSVQNIKEIGKLIKDINKKVVFHTDFVQGFGKYEINVKKYNIDFLSISSHKFHGPKGVGVLYKNKDVRINPLILGGGQQNNLRSGTLNVSGIVGTSVAANNVYADFGKNIKELLGLRDNMILGLNKLNEKHRNIFVHTKNNDNFAPHIVSVAFKGVRSEVMLHALEEKEIYVSAGSACSSRDKKVSSTLLAIGLKNDIAESTIRISFSKYNTLVEINEFLKVVDELLPKLLLKK